MRVEQTTLTRPDGARLALRIWEPDEAPRSVVQLSHGMMEHLGRYADLAGALVADGHAVIGADHRGHGGTEPGPRVHRADRDGWNTVVDDLLAVAEEAQRRWPDLPVFLLGHSWGSVLARDAIARADQPWAGAVVMGTAGPPDARTRVGEVVAQAFAAVAPRRPARLLDRLTFGPYNQQFAPTRTLHDWLSSDPAEVDAYEADPWSGGLCTNRFYADLAGGARRTASPELAARVPHDLPVLVISGAEDPVGGNGAGPTAVAGLLRAAGVEDVTLEIVDDARHELLHERTRDAVTSFVVNWLDVRRRATSKEQR